MIKLTVEIKDNKYIYSYEVGESRHTSESHLSADSLIVFNELLRQCTQADKWREKQREHNIMMDACKRELQNPAGSEGKNDKG